MRPDPLHCLRSQTALPPGCAQVYDWQRMRAETVIRQFDRAPPIDLLLARSLDPGFRPEVVDGQRVIIKGVILQHRLRPPRAS